MHQRLRICRSLRIGVYSETEPFDLIDVEGTMRD